MRFFTILLISFSIFVPACIGGPANNITTRITPYPEEKAANIGRGLVALPIDNSRVFLSWRLLVSDVSGTTFDVYKINTLNGHEEYLGNTEKTYFIDKMTSTTNVVNRYKVVAKGNDAPSASAETELASNAEHIASNISGLSYDLGEEYRQARLLVGDLNGNGEFEVVIQYSKDKNLDPYERFKKIRKSSDTIKVAAFLKTGEILWKMDLGWGIEAGVVYSPMVLWDIDADGKAEVILKTNPSGDPENYENEKITILDGESGKIKKEARWPTTNGLMHGPKINDRGTRDVYNNLSRNYLAIAHLDGKNPTIIAARGTYLTQKIVAFDINLNKQWEKLIGLNNFNPLGQIWKFDHKFSRIVALLKKDKYRGSHMVPIVDIDGDGKEEILWGDMCIGEGGKELWKIEERSPYNGHPDIVFAADINPKSEGYEVFYCREGWGKSDNNIGMAQFNNRGELLWGKWGYTHVDGGWVAKVVPESVGLQSFGFDVNKKIWKKDGKNYDSITGYLWNYDGSFIKEVSSTWAGSFPINWDGDEVREICLPDGSIVNYEDRLINKINGRPQWSGDVYGDHRDELVVSAKGTKVYIMFNVSPLEISPKLTPVADRRYRNDLSRTALPVVPMEGGYNYKAD